MDANLDGAGVHKLSRRFGASVVTWVSWPIAVTHVVPRVRIRPAQHRHQRCSLFKDLERFLRGRTADRIEYRVQIMEFSRGFAVVDRLVRARPSRRPCPRLCGRRHVAP